MTGVLSLCFLPCPFKAGAVPLIVPDFSPGACWIRLLMAGPQTICHKSLSLALPELGSVGPLKSLMAQQEGEHGELCSEPWTDAKVPERVGS